ncbi:MAG: glutamate 5-kinase [Clostridia bacterium]|nr:glutamate 5-kinase [Clostridia bacterium]
MEQNENFRRVVVKIGTSTLTYPSGKLNIRRIETLVRVLSDMRNAGREVVLVSSGAVSAGTSRLGLEITDRTTEEKQALAAVGQCEIMRLYERLFANYGHTVGQILVTKDVVDDENRLKLAKSTFATLIGFGCIPIVNENDSVSYEGIKFGGNDTLSAYVAMICDADLLINLSDIDGLYDSDPRKNKNARLIETVAEINDEIMACAGGVGTNRGTGGMITKLKAAKIATAAGIPMMILNGRDPRILYNVFDGEHAGTYFAVKEKVEA